MSKKKKDSTLQVYKISVEIYNRTVYILLGDKQEAVDYINDKELTTIQGYESAEGFSITLSDIYVWLDKEKLTIPLLIHELSHCTFGIFTSIGEEDYGQESFCYLLEYLCTKSLKLLKL